MTIPADSQLLYTLGFIRCKENNKLLLLNRNKAPWMGMYNGVGGKLHSGESPLECMVREANEETGLNLPDFKSRGVMRWEVNYSDKLKSQQQQPSLGGLYLFTADISLEQYENYRTPLVYNDEGILDWKDWDWVVHPDNYGVVGNIKIILQHLFDSKEEDLFTVKYNDGNLISCEYYPGRNPLYTS
ncbi:8-oxo-dGTP diphosphatase [Candida viswanathii]|uniref:8-oxo-dGTP diphosphatase n=1 Tax=Candida viswanathii TaxID=5486 RepID=A0A367XQK9_9ASCO|nr:8-oxo-dGTP diphosphatase [Candida viswanathii]